MNSPSLAQATERYKTAIAILGSSPAVNPSTPTVIPVSLSDEQMLEILTARDAVQAALADTTQTSGENLRVISQLDGTLRAHALTIAQAKPLPDWQKNFNPSKEAWWWFPETPKQSARTVWLWSALSLTCLTLSFSLIVDIVPRFLGGSPDLLSSFFVSLQSIGGLLSAGAVLKGIQETTQTVTTKYKLPDQSWAKYSAGVSAAILLGVVGVRLSLPVLSSQYTQWGLEQYKTGDWSRAESDFNRALKLDSDNPTAHFWLGHLYENLQNVDAARTQYQLAMKGGYIPAVNNLARLQIFNKNYSASVILLLKALNSEPETKKPLDAETRHAILKNLGWARLMQEDYPNAEAYLKQAIDLQKSAKLQENIAAPHCLLAQVKEAQGDKKGALPEWEVCNRDANSFNPDEDGWAITAQNKLAAAEADK
jgi:Tetratricopeptide repeat